MSVAAPTAVTAADGAGPGAPATSDASGATGAEAGTHGFAGAEGPVVPATRDAAGSTVLHLRPEQLLTVAAALRDDGYVQCVDLCAVDYLGAPPRSDLPAGVTPQRFEVVVTLASHETAQRVRLRVQVPGAEPVVPSLFDLYPGTENPEREAYDMFGIGFDGHPDPTRILMPEDWEGHPLRKDYAVGTVPVRFKAAGGVE